MPKKSYQIDYLFKTSWEQMHPRQIVELWSLKFRLEELEATGKQGQKEYGLTCIAILRLLRLRPLLVDKINVEQAVDCINDITFFRKPWLNFWEQALKYHGGCLLAPDERMHDRTLDHFIYADNEYSLYIIEKKRERLTRLAATLYTIPYRTVFKPDLIDFLARSLDIPTKDWQLMLIFYTFANIRASIMKRCKHLFPETRESDSKESPKPTGAMWLNLKHRLAETPVFQGFDTAGSAKLYTALDYLEDLATQKANQPG